MASHLCTKKLVRDITLFYSSGNDEQDESREKLTASIVDVPVKLVDAYCQRIVDF